MSEIEKFDALADEWWNPEGPMKPLHQLNPLRLEYIKNNTPLNKQKILDIGCGGGLLSETMAQCGANVTGIDLSQSLLKVAREHAEQANLSIDYQYVSSTDFLKTNANQFDTITCMELLEHVPDPNQLVQECAALVKPGGLVFFATLNRHWKAFLKAIIGAEYILQWLPKGTHQYAQFIRPSELNQWAQQNGLTFRALQGVDYNPLSGRFTLSTNVSVNYMAYYEKKGSSSDFAI